jgi:hypothetical protein
MTCARTLVSTKKAVGAHRRAACHRKGMTFLFAT